MKNRIFSFYIDRLILFGLACTTALANAQIVDPPASFAIIGHIEKFTLAPPGDIRSRATVTVRGIDVILPSNLVITMPGGYLTAQQLFRGRDFKSAPGRSGLALQEMTEPDMACPWLPQGSPTKCPLPAAEIELAGNIIPVAGTLQYVAGIARISQGALHIGSGFIRSIDPNNTGFFTVGADLGGAPASRMRLNDPEGIYGPTPDPTKPLLLDQRFALDPGNSPVHARTGFPVCLPDSARPGLCPSSNRSNNASAANYRRFTCGASPSGVTEPVLPGCQPHLPIPLRVGDYVNYVGMLDKDDQGYFYSLHGLEAELGVYTSPGVDPAYVFIEVSIQGTMGARWPLNATTTIPQEATSIFKLVGFTTDPGRTISVDLFDDPSNFAPLAITPPVPGNPRATRLATKIVPTNLAQLGRFKMEWAAKEDARVVRRSVRVKLSDATAGTFNQLLKPGASSNSMEGLLPAGASKRSGYAFGQYEAPISEYISPEITRFGAKGWPVPVNFEDFCYLKTPNKIATQELDIPPLVVGPVSPFPAAPARTRSQLKTDGTRVCGD